MTILIIFLIGCLGFLIYGMTLTKLIMQEYENLWVVNSIAVVGIILIVGTFGYVIYLSVQ